MRKRLNVCNIYFSKRKQQTMEVFLQNGSAVINSIAKHTLLEWLTYSLFHFPHSIYHFIIIFPMRRLYLNGPDMFSGIGGWGGKTNAQICSIMTDTAENIWIQQDKACGDLIQRRFESILIVCETSFYIFILCKILYEAINHFFYFRPIMSQMNRLQILLEKTLLLKIHNHSKTPVSSS